MLSVYRRSINLRFSVGRMFGWVGFGVRHILLVCLICMIMPRDYSLALGPSNNRFHGAMISTIFSFSFRP
jgi:hypothetical protein